MILEIFLGLFVSTFAIISFRSIKYVDSINDWILVTSKFIYYSGHPLMDDDQIYEQITKRFRMVFIAISIVIFKTIIFSFLIVVLHVLTVLLVLILTGTSLPNFDPTGLSSLIFPEYLMQIPFITGSLVPVLLMPIWYKNDKKNSYSSIEKFLHYVFLGNKNIAKILFTVELWLNKNQLEAIKNNQNVYISGMARAGTTVLMQYLGQIKEFKSLSYKNLPFLFLPKTGPRLISKNKNKKSERSHKDGINHSINSYEALEEPFWRNYIGQKYIKNKTIIGHSINQELFLLYNSFRRLIAGNNIYLAKNNNHLIRAVSLHQLDRKNNNFTTTIIPFRDPYQQAKSLLNQHILLSKLQIEDEFALDYMDFLVHHEFGLHHKVILLNKKRINSISNIDKRTVEYWLAIWLIFYDQIYETYKGEQNVYFFCYENFRDNPKKSLELLLLKLKIPIKHIDFISIKEFKSQPINDIGNINEEYINLYNKLKLIAINNYG